MLAKIVSILYFDAMKANNHYYIDYDKVTDYLSHGAAALTKLYSVAPE